MLGFLAENWGSILIAAIVAAAVGFIVLQPQPLPVFGYMP